MLVFLNLMKGVFAMDHVIDDLKRWLETFEESEPDNKKAHKCIENALDELYKYYPKPKDE